MGRESEPVETGKHQVVVVGSSKDHPAITYQYPGKSKAPVLGYAFPHQFSRSCRSI
jgi:hypothetical protein